MKQLYLHFKGAYQIVESISFCQKSYLFFCDCRFKLRESKVDGKSELPVYNYVSDANNITWGQYMHLSRKGFHEPFDKALWWVYATHCAFGSILLFGIKINILYWIFVPFKKKQKSTRTAAVLYACLIQCLNIAECFCEWKIYLCSANTLKQRNLNEIRYKKSKKPGSNNLKTNVHKLETQNELGIAN